MVKNNKHILLAKPFLKGNELKYVSNCIKTGWISSLGKYVTDFETKFGDFCGTKYGIATCNGTVALHLALVTIGIGKGDEVIVPDLTFVATANAVLYSGAKPVFVDSDPVTWNIDPAKIEDKISKRTKAIILVHLYGHPCDMAPIMKIARKYNLYVIEDAAEAHGAEYKGKRVGSIGDMGCFSFYGNKLITTGEGGMLVTDSATWDKRARFLRDHGMAKKRRYFHPEIGYNYRFTNIQAALGLAQLERFGDILKKKTEIASYYNKLLSGVKGITFAPRQEWAKSVCWLYTILIEKDFGLTRDRVMAALKKEGVETRPFFIPMNLLPAYQTKERFPVAEGLSKKGLNLPSAADLKKSDIEYICRVIRDIKTKAKTR